MKIAAATPGRFEFTFPEKDTLVVVENRDTGVVIRASRPTFTAVQKAAFVRHLVDEAFVPEPVRTREISTRPAPGGVQWLIDESLLNLPEWVLSASRRHGTRLVAGCAMIGIVIIVAGLLLTP